MLTKVRDMQEEIKELNRQIAEENGKFKAKQRAEKAEQAKIKQIKKNQIKGQANQKPKAKDSLSSKQRLLEVLTKSKSSPTAKKLGSALRLLIERQKLRNKPPRTLPHTQTLIFRTPGTGGPKF